ncbi:MAG TPA: DUF2520 domain-containing protein [Ignavibacteria bacterium]|nr:DUF2520 domain-containing protein [Ignavibacteria bacterium]
MNAKKLNICIIGAGKLGSHLITNLVSRKYSIKYVVNRDEKVNNIIRKDFKKVFVTDKISKDVINDSDVILICVQDRYISNVFKRILSLKLNLKNKYFIHTSGSLTSDIFKSRAVNSKRIASFHPVQTFSSIDFKNKKIFDEVYFGIEGGSEAISLLKNITKSLNSNYLIIDKKYKTIYHIACVISSNYLVTQYYLLDKILRKIGINNAKASGVFKSIVNETISNIDKKGAVLSLTGPVVRGDKKIINEHISEIRSKIPELYNYYTELLKLTSQVAKEKKALSK